jgi:hypothetical protein
MRLAQHDAERIFRLGNRHQVHVICHEAPSQYADPLVVEAVPQKPDVALTVGDGSNTSCRLLPRCVMSWGTPGASAEGMFGADGRRGKAREEESIKILRVERGVSTTYPLKPKLFRPHGVPKKSQAAVI